MLHEMAEPGSLDNKQVASLAPQAGDGGQHRAILPGGRAILRQALSMPALVAARGLTLDRQAVRRVANAGRYKPKLSALP